MKNFKYSLVKLPPNIQTSLYLIREELKSRRFFNTLQKMGLDDCYFKPQLDELIVRKLNLEDSDAIFNQYMVIMDHRSRKISTDQESATRQAIKAYYELKALHPPKIRS